jgi:murein DD-endopeptidase MepM/ murein hydrolase activator NlpD
MIRSSKRNKKSLSRFLIIFLLLAVVAAAGISAIVFFEGEKPQITLTNISDFIGSTTEIGFTATDAQSGLRSVKVIVVQDRKETILFSENYPRTRYTGKIGPAREGRNILIQPRKLKLKDGPAEIVIEAHDYSLRGNFTGNVSILKKSITIDTQPPKIGLLHTERYIKPGGSGIVIYRLSEDAVVSGVEINSHFYAGYPMGNDKKLINIAYIALSYDASQIDVSQIVAKDRAGNRSVIPFSIVLENTTQKMDRINISDGFLQSKMPEFEQHYPELKGDLKEQYLYANNTIRQENNKKIFSVCQHPSPERLWQGRFLRMPGSKRAGFADHRTYYYKGEPFDKQVHLGVDLAQVERAEVKAANDGKVIFTEYLGIYGNTIILDHGQGVFSLYSHLSEFDVKPGDMVKKDTVIGRTGHTGMAGGDHLHFSMLVDGIFVTPLEWWDQHWIDVTIAEPLRDVK